MNISNSPDLLTGKIGERIFTIAEIAAQYQFHPDTVRKLFFNEPGVIALARTAAGKRRYATIRVPASVVDRVFARLTTKGISA